jgi:two-component system KDP operon response regulator KdpE
MPTPISSLSGGKNSSEPERPSGRILIVDDEYSVRRALHITLYDQGFDVSEASSGEEAIALARVITFDAVLLDMVLPGKGGIEVCRELRKIAPRLAIVVVSVRDAEDDQVEALDAGADDYVTKPFQMRELTARIRSAVRRAKASALEAEEAISIGDIALYPARRSVTKGGQPVHLTPKEFDLLAFLMRRAGMPVTHASLLSAVWGTEYTNQVEYLRTFIRQLRGKLEDDRTNPKYLLTENHIGYRFIDQEAERGL